jgi:hypothetical protein
MKNIITILILFTFLSTTMLLAQTSKDKQNLKKYFKDFGDTAVYNKYFKNLDSTKKYSISVQSNSARKFYDNMPTISPDTNYVYNMPTGKPGDGTNYNMPVVPFFLEKDKNCDKTKKNILKLPKQDALNK